jgi:acyl phosphate:glycerol-3-phosphate acyltransferase
MMLALTLLCSYVLGCLSPGWWLVRRKTGADVRAAGSGGTGATNAARVLGGKSFALVLALDAAKAAVAIFGARWLAGGDPWSALALPAVVVGHIWPVTLGFRGGRGAGPMLGGCVALNWLFAPVAAIPAAVVYALTRRTFAASAAATAGGVIGAWWLLPGREERIAFCVALGLVVLAHRDHLVKMAARHR